MAKDILLDEDWDLNLKNGDFTIGDSEQQDVELIFHALKGEFKEYLLVGFGAARFLKTSKNNTADFIRELELQLEYNGFENPEVDLSEGFEKIKINV